MTKESRNILIIILLFLLAIVFATFYYNFDMKDDNKLEAITEKSSQVENNINNQDNKNINQNTNMENENKTYTEAVLHTSLGDISFEFSKDKPLTTENFIKLSESGFYDGVKFHRVINGFMIQTGDPLSKDSSKKSSWGTGGPGYKFSDELTGKEQYQIGTVAMANSGPNTNGSQFFIMTSNISLPPNYTVFGKVILGQDIANKIQEVKTDASDRPLEDIIINSIELK